MKKKLLASSFILGVALMLTGCGGGTKAITPEVADTGAESEEAVPSVVYKDATNVEIYKAEDHVPDVVYMCVGTQGWATTLTKTQYGNGVAAPLVRFAEYDSRCLDN